MIGCRLSSLRSLLQSAPALCLRVSTKKSLVFSCAAAQDRSPQARTHPLRPSPARRRRTHAHPWLFARPSLAAPCPHPYLLRGLHHHPCRASLHLVHHERGGRDDMRMRMRLHQSRTSAGRGGCAYAWVYARPLTSP